MLEKFKNKAKIAANSQLFARFSKLTLLFTPLIYIRVGDTVIEILKCIEAKHELIKAP